MTYTIKEIWPIVIFLVIAALFIIRYMYSINKYINNVTKYYQWIKLRQYIVRLEKEHNQSILIIVDDNIDISDALDKYIISIEDHLGINNWLRTNILESKLIPNHSIHIIIHTTGGSVKSSDAIFNTIINSDVPIYTHVPFYAYSAGTMIALASHKIYMNPYSNLSPVDPQLVFTSNNVTYTFSSKVLIDLMKKKKNIDDILYLNALDAQVYHNDDIENLKIIFNKRIKNKKNISKLVNIFGSGNYPHSKPFYYEYLESLGLHVDNNQPQYIKDIMSVYIKLTDC